MSAVGIAGSFSGLKAIRFRLFGGVLPVKPENRCSRMSADKKEEKEIRKLTFQGLSFECRTVVLVAASSGAARHSGWLVCDKTPIDVVVYRRRRSNVLLHRQAARILSRKTKTMFRCFYFSAVGCGGGRSAESLRPSPTSSHEVKVCVGCGRGGGAHGRVTSASYVTLAGTWR